MRSLQDLVLAALALFLTAFLFAPTAAYVLNAYEISVSLATVLAAAWPAAAGFVLLTLALARLGTRVRPQVTAIYLLLATVLYLQGNVFVWDYGPFDGSDIDWGRFHGRGFLELAVIAALAVGLVVARRRLTRITRPLAVGLIVFQALTVGLQLARGGSLRAQAATAGASDIFAFSPERNVLVLVLDAFQQSAFTSVLADRPELHDRLDGFTLYRDALGVYPTTMFSVPAMLSSRLYDNTRPIGEFLAESFAASLPVVLAESGVAAHTVTKPSYCPYLPDVHCAGQRDWLEDPDLVRRRDVLQIWDLALFRSSPHFVRMRVYADHEWLLQRSFAPADAGPDEDGERMSLEHFHRASWNLWDRLLADADATARIPTCKFIHVYTSHSPFVLDASCEEYTKQEYARIHEDKRYLAQCACTVRRLEATLDRLEELGVYDRTMIVVTADHGSKTALLPRERGWHHLPDVNRVFPLLLVKPIGARGRLGMSRAPVSLVDLPRTICDALEVPSRFEGFSLLGEIPATRRRRYFDYRWESGYWQADYLSRMQEFEIVGPAEDSGSWRRVRIVTEPGDEGPPRR